MLKIVGLGPGSAGALTLNTLNAMENADSVILRTMRHPAVSEIEKRGIKFTTCDSFYESNANFDDVYNEIAGHVFCASLGKNIVYAVPGSPMVAEKTVLLLRERMDAVKAKYEIIPSVSFLDELFARLGVDPLQQGITIIDASDTGLLPATLTTPVVIAQVYDKFVLSDVKIALAGLYGDEYQVVYAADLGMENEIVQRTPIFELDRNFEPDHLTSLFVPAKDFAGEKFDLSPLTTVMAELRSETGCVWDIEQTHHTLRRYIIEEVYEVLEAIEERDAGKMCEELGDLLLQIVFHARIAEENGDFTVQDVVNGVCEKMIRRHPHVFGDTTVRDAAEVLLNWEQIKKNEKQEQSSALSGVYSGLPSLMHAQKIQEKASKKGFDWPDITPVWAKLDEELDELRNAISVPGNKADIEHEFGDVLFTIVNLGRFIGLEAETALNAANLRFRSRFLYIEEKIRKNGNNWNNISPEMLDKLWEEAKIILK